MPEEHRRHPHYPAPRHGYPLGVYYSPGALASLRLTRRQGHRRLGAPAHRSMTNKNRKATRITRRQSMNDSKLPTHSGHTLPGRKILARAVSAAAISSALSHPRLEPVPGRGDRYRHQAQRIGTGGTAGDNRAVRRVREQGEPGRRQGPGVFHPRGHRQQPGQLYRRHQRPRHPHPGLRGGRRSLLGLFQERPLRRAQRLCRHQPVRYRAGRNPAGPAGLPVRAQLHRRRLQRAYQAGRSGRRQRRLPGRGRGGTGSPGSGRRHQPAHG